MKRKHMGTVLDRFVTPYVKYTYLPDDNIYVDFPFGIMPSILPSGSPSNPTVEDYQSKRYYTDERPMTYVDFKEMCKGHYCG